MKAADRGPEIKMTDATMTPDNDNGGEWVGHPKGLFYLFFAEMWERFCFYGMRNILVLYMVNYFMFEKAEAQGGVYAAYTAMVYCVAMAGGYLADKYMGYRRSIMLGGVQMALGMTMLLINDEIFGWIGMSVSKGVEEFFFYTGLATVVVGNGFFKPNISTIVGKLYQPGDPRRDGGFTIFYMGINIGAFAGGIICAEIGERISWPLGFALAAAGMLLGVVTFGSKGATKALQGHGDAQDPELAKKSFPTIVIGSFASIGLMYFLLHHSAVVGWILGLGLIATLVLLLVIAFREEVEQRQRMFALVILLMFNPIFWAFFEQAGSSLTLFANEHLDKSVFGLFEMASGSVQNFNALFIVLGAPVFAWLWVKLAKAGKEPSIPLKFSLGLFQLGAGFYLLVIGARYFSPDGTTPLIFMAGLYLLLTTGELCISPVGLSMVTKLAPARITGMVMGAWFLSIAGANFLAGQIAALTGAEEETASGSAAALAADMAGDDKSAAEIVAAIQADFGPALATEGKSTTELATILANELTGGGTMAGELLEDGKAAGEIATEIATAGKKASDLATEIAAGLGGEGVNAADLGTQIAGDVAAQITSSQASSLAKEIDAGSQTVAEIATASESAAGVAIEIANQVAAQFSVAAKNTAELMAQMATDIVTQGRTPAQIAADTQKAAEIATALSDKVAGDGQAAATQATEMVTTKVASLIENISNYADIYELSAWFVFAAATVLLVLVPLIKKWMHGVK